MEKNLQTIMQEIQNYQPYNEQEENDRCVILNLLETQPSILERTNRVAHFSASSWILNKEHTKVLMIYHNIYNAWAWTGGHADGDADLMAVAYREGSYVPSHLHLNVTYLFEADEEEILRVKPDENSGVKWFSFTEALEQCSEPWMVHWIYSKLMHKLEKLDHERGI